MFTYEEAIELIREEKTLFSPLNLSILENNWKIELKSNINEHNKFFLDISINSQGFNIVLSANLKTLKTSHNHRIDKIPLIRLDCGGRHKNPEKANNKVPNWIIQFAGKDFNRDEPHVHIYVESYSLRWAVPSDYFELDGKRFSLRSITSFKDFLLATEEFAYIINIINFSNYFKVNRTLFE